MTQTQQHPFPVDFPLVRIADVRRASAAAGSPFFHRRSWSTPSVVVGGPYRADDTRGYFVTRDYYRDHATGRREGPVTFNIWEYGPAPAIAGGFDIRHRAGHAADSDTDATAIPAAGTRAREHATALAARDRYILRHAGPLQRAALAAGTRPGTLATDVPSAAATDAELAAAYAATDTTGA